MSSSHTAILYISVPHFLKVSFIISKIRQYHKHKKITIGRYADISNIRRYRSTKIPIHVLRWAIHVKRLFLHKYMLNFICLLKFSVNS